MSHNSRLGRNVKKEYYGNLKVPYLLLENWFTLRVRISSYGSLEN